MFRVIEIRHVTRAPDFIAVPTESRGLEIVEVALVFAPHVDSVIVLHRKK